MNMEKYLPLGSVVLLNGAKKRVMIIGFMVSSQGAEGKVFDYMGCVFPEGVISSEQSLVFNHNQIGQVFCLGYSDDEEKKFRNKLKSLENNKLS